MKILFLHLSDIHINSSQKFDMNIIDSLIQSLAPLNINKAEHCIIFLTGDIAYSGLDNEYKKARFLIGGIIAKLKEKYPHLGYINVYVVPGNHDMNFANKKRERFEVARLIKEKQIDEYIPNELKKFNSFFDYAKSNSCFKNGSLIDILFFNIGAYSIQINLINSELFSTFKDEDNDKGIHYLPLNEIEKIRRRPDSNLVISLIHRSSEWFERESGNKLKDFLQRDSDIVFIGHEHVDNINFIDNVVISIAKGMDFNNCNFSFSTVLLNTLTNKCKTSIFNWNDKKGLFYITEEKDTCLTSNTQWNLKPKYDYLRDLDSDERDMSIKRYFVFPGAEDLKENVKNREDITDWNAFIDMIKNNKKVIIEGDNLSGKSTILKQIYIEIQKDKIPIYLDVDTLNFKHMDKLSKDMDKVIKNAFEEQYEDATDYLKFQIMDISKRVVIIDDFNRIRTKHIKAVFECLEEKFGCIIVSCNAKWTTDIIEETRSKLSTENQNDSIAKFRLLPFYANKRKELIQKYYEANGLGNYSIDKEVDKINGFIKNQLKIFDLNPSFITMYVSYCMQTREVENTSNVFGRVFEINLGNAIRRHTSDSNLDEFYVVLEKIAYHIHFNEIYPISIDEISKIILEYNKKYDLRINIHDFLTIMQLAKIIKGEDNFFKFTNNNLLAYFVAKSLKVKMQDENCDNELNKLADNICFNINGEIILFLSYITDNYKILDFLKDTAIKHMDNWTEFSFDLDNIEFLNGKEREITLNLPSQKDREKEDIQEAKREKNIKKNQNSIVKNLYEYDEEDKFTAGYKFGQAIRYTELIAKILPNFNHRLDKEKKKSYVDLIYRYPNKIIYDFFHEIDESFSSIITEIYEFLCEIGIQNITKEIIKKELINAAEYSIFDVLSHYTRLCVNEKTILTLQSYESDDTNHLLQKMLMFHHIGNFSSFSKYANNIYDNTKKPMIKSIIKRAAYRHLLINKNLKMVGNVASFAQKYFHTSDKTKFIK